MQSIKYDAEQTMHSMDRMASYIKATGATLWVNHDPEQSTTAPKSLGFTE